MGEVWAGLGPRRLLRARGARQCDKGRGARQCDKGRPNCFQTPSIHLDGDRDAVQTTPDYRRRRVWDGSALSVPRFGARDQGTGARGAERNVNAVLDPQLR